MNKKIGFLVTIGLGVLRLGVAQEVNADLHTFSNSFQTTAIDQVERERDQVVLHLDSIIQKSGGGGVSVSQEDINIGLRINRLQKTIPLEYNDKVKVYLDKYISSNYKPYIEKLLGLSDYYFPIYDQIFKEQGIPEEVKFLSVVESSLNPHTVSSSGAVGPWQFMYATARFHNLTMNSLYDERKDVFASTYAVSTYLKEAHDEFNDWLLALASYNCGRGCVRRAIQRSGLNNPNYWELSPFLPKETQNYIPKYIAMTYVMSHSDLYGLVAEKSSLSEDYRVLMVDKNVKLGNIAQSLGYSTHLLQELNPGYKKAIVAGTAEKPLRLIIPINDRINDSLVYAALNNQIALPKEKVYEVDEDMAKNLIAAKRNNSTKKSSSSYVSYIVRKGDTLSDIANRYKGASVSRIKSDNNIKGSHLKIGQRLKVYKKK